MNLITRIWNKIREKQPRKNFPNVYLVTINVDHPRIIGHLVRFNVSIDAHDKDHARSQVLKELQIKVDKQVRKIR